MKNLNKVSVIILTYKTPQKIIHNCLKSIDKRVNILIIENSNKFEHKNYIKSKFPKTKFFNTGENLGYGQGNNFGLKKTKTDYALILNPDVVCHKNFFKNLSALLKNDINFDIIGADILKSGEAVIDYKKKYGKLPPCKLNTIHVHYGYIKKMAEHDGTVY